MRSASLQSDSIVSRCRFMFGNAAADRVSLERLASDMRYARLSLPFRAYYQLRSLLPLPIRHLLQRYRRVATSPRWCFPDLFIQELGEEIAAIGDELTIIHPWPGASQFAFVLTHDVETSEGARRV